MQTKVHAFETSALNGMTSFTLRLSKLRSKNLSADNVGAWEGLQPVWKWCECKSLCLCRYCSGRAPSILFLKDNLLVMRLHTKWCDSYMKRCTWWFRRRAQYFGRCSIGHCEKKNCTGTCV